MFSINAAIMNLSFIWNISEDRAGQLIGLSTLPFPIVVRSQVISFVSSTHIFTKIFSFCFLQISEVKKSKEKCPLLSHFFHSLTHSLPLTSSFSPPHSLFLSLILSPSFSISLSLFYLSPFNTLISSSSVPPSIPPGYKSPTAAMMKKITSAATLLLQLSMLLLSLLLLTLL